MTGGHDRFAPQTVTDPARLRRELADCRRTGTAIVRQELTPGTDSVVIRIMEAEGRVVATLSDGSGSIGLKRHAIDAKKHTAARQRFHSP